MVQHHNPNIVSVEEERRREEVWRTATHEVINIATERYTQLAALLGLGPQSAKAFVGAAMEATRQYQTGYMYANYEKRTGHPFPDEGHENEDKVWDQAWEMALNRLKATLGK